MALTPDQCSGQAPRNPHFAEATQGFRPQWTNSSRRTLTLNDQFWGAHSGLDPAGVGLGLEAL